LRFDSRIGHVNLMAGGHGFVVTENSCGKGVGRPAKSCVTAFRVDGVGRAVWRKTLPGVVLALHATASTLYVGGQFSSVAGHPRSNLAALALDKTGRLLSFAPEVPLPVSALAQTDYGLVFGTNAFRTGSGAPYFVGVEALGAVSPDGTVLPWAMSFPPNAVPLYLSDNAAQSENFLVAELTPVPGGLVARGDFSWIGPDEDPAPGTLVWLR
jgi:hypothetical protein